VWNFPLDVTFKSTNPHGCKFSLHLYTGGFVEHTFNYTPYKLTAVFEQDVHYAALKESIYNSPKHLQ
jgi:hypothetical protein